MAVLKLSCLEFQDFVSVLNCLVLRNSCLDPSLEEINIDEKEISNDILTRIWNFEDAKEKGSGEALNINKILNDTSFTIEESPPIDFDFMDMIIDKNQKDKSFMSKENVKENMAKFDVTSFIKRKNSSFHKEF